MKTQTDPILRSLQGILHRRNGALSGSTYRIRREVFRVGRDSANDLVMEDPDCSIVSAQHLEIRQQGDSFILKDLESTNGTFVDGVRVTEVTLQNRVSIVLGPGGPEFQFEIAINSDGRINQTLRLDHVPQQLPPEPAGQVSILLSSTARNREQEDLIREAVSQARRVRRSGLGGQTSLIMRQMLDKALHRSSRKFKWMIALLVTALIAVTFYSAWTVRRLQNDKRQIDSQINLIESELQSVGDDPKRMDELLERLNSFQSQAVKMQKNLLYQLGVRDREEDLIESEIKQLLSEFGAEEYSIPSEFIDQVQRFVRQYQERDRAHMERALGRSRKELELARRQLESDNLPPDLAYMVLVESAFINGSSSSAGAAGLWQFTPITARAYGLKVTAQIDERLDARKATQAAGRYIRELILDFGTGSSVMLALAAYNLGPGKVKHAVRTVRDPIKQRNFWYLYRTKALPAETREYIPKTISAIIIGRHPNKFGF